MYIAALFAIHCSIMCNCQIIPKIGKQSKCPSVDEWIKMWYIYIMEYYMSAQSCQTHCDPMDYSPPGSSVHGIIQARTL